MRFSIKLALAITVLLAVSLSVGGYLLVRQNFQDSLQNVVRQNLNQHIMEKYTLEAELLDLTSTGIAPDDNQLRRYGQHLTEYMGGGGRWTAFYAGDLSEIYSNFDGRVSQEDRLAATESGTDNYLIRPVEGGHVMLLASNVETMGRQLWLLNGYDMDAVFGERDRQMANFLRMAAIVLAGSAVVIVLLASRLTRPIRRLNLVSRKIASGAYAVRTGFTGGDEVGQLGRNFDKMAGAVEQKVEALNASVHQRDDFVAAFTHEIKTPMTSIIGYSDILRSTEYEPAVRQKAANYIFHESKRLESLSQKLLMLMGLSQEQPVMKPVQLNTLFAVAGRSVVPLMEGTRLDFTPAGAVHVLADMDLAADLLRNLMLNAAKAEPEDEAVHISWQLEWERVRILVRDTGRGIPPEELERIIEPFYMVDKSRARASGGSGLGLALSERIAVLHGGHLQFESQVGVGTTVSFTLPYCEEGGQADDNES
ncbi:MAG: HAMP domain-containing histidine kinase [Ruminococcaceae bacterium]|nr:HAMP domain-containing histidine kinase [Oscillospiraceae bacterium]